MNLDEFWQDYLQSIPEDEAKGLKQPQAWHFCDNQKDADELAELVLAGKKVATSALEWEYQKDGEPIPTPGDLSIVINWMGEPKAIIRTTRVGVRPFSQVSGEHAYLEGEGDQSLEFWCRVHESVFIRRCREMGRQFNEDVMVICERFEKVWP